MEKLVTKIWYEDHCGTYNIYIQTPLSRVPFKIARIDMIDKDAKKKAGEYVTSLSKLLLV